MPLAFILSNYEVLDKWFRQSAAPAVTFFFVLADTIQVTLQLSSVLPRFTDEMHQELATLLLATLFEYNYDVLPRRLIPDSGTGMARIQGGQYLMPERQFPLGCASVVAIVSMAAKAIRIIDFMVDSNLQIISYCKPSSLQ